jgi:LysM repeat protein
VAPDPFWTYTTQPGDTLMALSGRYGVSATSIAHASGLPNPDRLSVDTLLTIPRVNGWLHRVQAGETYASIASLYGVAEADVASANVGHSLVAQSVVLVPRPLEVLQPK